MSWMTDVLLKSYKGSDKKINKHIQDEIARDFNAGKITRQERFWRMSMSTSHSESFEIHKDILKEAGNLTSLAGYYTNNNTLVSFNEFRKLVEEQDKLCEHLQLVIASNWSYGKTTFNIDNTIAESIVDDLLKDIPTSILKHVPANCFYIDYKIGQYAGAFFSILISDTKIEILVCLPVLDSEDLVFAYFNVKQSSSQSEELAHTVSEHDRDISKYFNLVLLLCCKNMEIVGHSSVRPGPSLHRKTNAPMMTTTERSFDIGFRQGAALRAAEQSARDSASEVTGRTVAPHVRRAHWHHFWVGSRDAADRNLVLHWIAPTFVGVKDECVETRRAVS
jgi:hypothetical protein